MLILLVRDHLTYFFEIICYHKFFKTTFRKLNRFSFPSEKMEDEKSYTRFRQLNKAVNINLVLTAVRSSLR
jgi:hypothetical protein